MYNYANNQVSYKEIQDIAKICDTPINTITYFVKHNVKYIPDETNGAYYPPLQFINRGGGDCEDFAGFIVFALKDAGIPHDDLRIAMVAAGGDKNFNHVTAVYKDVAIENSGDLYKINENTYDGGQDVILSYLKIDKNGLVY